MIRGQVPLHRSCLLTIVAFASSMMLAHDALADMISDNQAECLSKAEGDACQLDDKAGKCVKSTCSRNDYSGGTPPKRVDTECLLCTPGSADAPVAEPVPARIEPPAKAETKSGCASGDAPGSAWLLASVVLGLGCVGLGRRRRSRD